MNDVISYTQFFIPNAHAVPLETYSKRQRANGSVQFTDFKKLFQLMAAEWRSSVNLLRSFFFPSFWIGFLICVIFVFRKPIIKLFKQRFAKETHPAPTTNACKQPTSRSQQPANTAEQRTSGAEQATNKAEEQTYEAEKTCPRGARQPVEEAEQSLDANEQVICGTLQANFGAEQA